MKLYPLKLHIKPKTACRDTLFPRKKLERCITHDNIKEDESQDFRGETDNFHTHIDITHPPWSYFPPLLQRVLTLPVGKVKYVRSQNGSYVRSKTRSCVRGRGCGGTQAQENMSGTISGKAGGCRSQLEACPGCLW